MLLKLHANVSKDCAEKLQDDLSKQGYKNVLHTSANRFSLVILEHKQDNKLSLDQLNRLSIVEQVIPIKTEYKLASKDIFPEQTAIKIRKHTIGGDQLTIIAGSCAVESKEQIFVTAHIVSELGAVILRGGAFKTSYISILLPRFGGARLTVFASCSSNLWNAMCI